MNIQLKRLSAAACAALLVCSTLTACGGDKAPDAASTAEKNQGETTTSTFSGGKSADKNTSPKPAASPSGKTSVSTVQSELDEALSFVQSGMIADAREMLGYIDRDSLNDAQAAQYDEIQAMLSVSESLNSEFTADDAIKFVEEKYGIELPSADGLQSETDENGRVFYHMQIELPSQNERKTINVYRDGEIIELSTEAYAFG